MSQVSRASGAGRRVRRQDRGGVLLEDGPAAGRYTLRRAPFFLRAVVASTGRIDVLDLLGDTPEADERVHVYEAIPGTIGPDLDLAGILICPPPSIATGRYRHRADVDGERFRRTEAWRAWCRSQPTGQQLGDPAPQPAPAEVAR